MRGNEANGKATTSLLRGANVTCHDFECVVGIENQLLALTLQGPRTTTWPALSSADPIGNTGEDAKVVSVWSLETVRLNFAPCDVIRCVKLLAKPSPPEGWTGPAGLGSRDHLGAKPELPAGLRVFF